MASWTTPRTANVGDTWTAAWYNGEVRDNETWLHDLAVSQGSSFPSSPATGQRHLFVSGNTRLMFTWNGSNWISDVIESIDMIVTEFPWRGIATYPNGILAGPFTIGGGTLTQNLREWIETAKVIDVLDTVKNNAMTLQARIHGMGSRGGTGTGLAWLSVGCATAAALGSAFGADSNSTATEAQLSNTGFYSGAWADLASGVAAVRPTIYLRQTDGSGATIWNLLGQTVQLRLKK